MGFLATLLADHKSRKAVSAPLLKWSRHAALAHCCGRDALRMEEATRVGVNPRNELFHEGALGLRAMLNGITEGYVNELTLLCSGMSDYSLENVSSASINQGLLS